MRTTRTERKIREETSPGHRGTRRLTREHLRSLVRDLVLDGDPVPDWHERAACSGMDTEVFFPPTERGAAGQAAVQAAKDVCAGCAVQVTCLADAMTRETASARYGVFGGYSAGDRSRLYLQLRAAALASDPAPGPIASCSGCAALFPLPAIDGELCPACWAREVA